MATVHPDLKLCEVNSEFRLTFHAVATIYVNNDWKLLQ